MSTASSPLQRLDPAAISDAARKESRRRDAYLPPISTFRWWARRTEAVNGGILDAYVEDDSSRLTVVDPFAGGGTIALAAAARNHQVLAQDINPWATLGLKTMMALPQASVLREACHELGEKIRPIVKKAYKTTSQDGSPAWIRHTLRVASAACPDCATRRRLFPYAMVSLKERKDTGGQDAYLACPQGHLVENEFNVTTDCPHCNLRIDPEAHYTSGRNVECLGCGATHRLDSLAQRDTWRWEAVLVERHGDTGRVLASPTDAELRQASDRNWSPKTRLPEIRAGLETEVLRRFDFTHWHDLYPARQRVILEHLLSSVDKHYGDTDCGRALRLAALGTAEMAGLISRWDRWYLKSYEGMANHRFNVTTLAVEPNVWGGKSSGRGTFTRRIRQLVRASEWFEDHTDGQLQAEGPLPAAGRMSTLDKEQNVRIVEGSSQRIPAPESSVDLILTDPPYHDDIQYDELSLPFRAWAGMSTARLPNEAVVNRSRESDEDGGTYLGVLTDVFSECKRILKVDGHLIFTYANRDVEAWIALINALDRAGFEVAGYEILHSDNETDQAKRGVRACRLDLVVDAVPKRWGGSERWRPNTDLKSEEADYLHIIGSMLLQVGSLPDGWEDNLGDELTATSFLS